MGVDLRLFFNSLTRVKDLALVDLDDRFYVQLSSPGVVSKYLDPKIYVDGKKSSQPRVSGNNSLPQRRRGTRKGGNGSYQLPGAP